jgi:serine/threonine protein kinase
MSLGQVLFKQYKIIAKIGSGGFGETYLAIDTAFPGEPRRVVKHLAPKNNDPENLAIAKRLFQTEANVLSILGESDCIPRLFSYFEEDGDFFLVQELIEGHDLTQEFQTGKKWSEAETIQFLKELLEILSFVHQNNAIHRDLKPANIMRRQKDGKLVLIDFGAVKEKLAVDTQSQTDLTVAIGTPPYISPEQAIGRPKKSSDIYAVGILGIQALTGLSPGELFQKSEQLSEIWNTLNLEIEPRLKEILGKMTNFQHQKRFPDAIEALKALTETKLIPLNPSPNIRQKSRLPWSRLKLSLAFGISAIGIISILLAKKFLPITNIIYAPQLPLNGEVVEGVLDSNSQIEPLNNTYSDVYLFKGRKEQKIKIEMSSKELDPSLILSQPDRHILAINDDISPENFNSRIVATLPEDGSYQVIVRASQPGEIGNYQLKAFYEEVNP